jgi:hypothetical protein
VLEVPQLELLLDALAAQQGRVLLDGRSRAGEAHDGVLEVLLAQRDELVARGVEGQPLVHLVTRPL